ncbi:MAG: DJ-1/PfpI family protein [Roseburia sp.]|nr:DJ-1/PfpI family protein [Roseburia sp.]MCM1278628.1 DJ-1/PfpI family protein [Robinsoniella sp.]
MNKVCVFFGTGFEEIEALTVVDLLRRAAIDVSMVSITGEKGVESSHKVLVETDMLLEEVDFSQVKMIVLPGGMPGTKNLEACKLLMEQVERFYEEGKYLSAICAAPSILGHRGMLKGRNACSYPDFESHLEGAKVTKNPVEISEHIITSRGMGTAIEFGLAIVARMKGEDTAKELADKIIYKQ